MGDFNAEPADSAVSGSKSPSSPSWIDLIITNRPKSLHNSMVTETDLSDFHKMCITVIKMYCSKQKLIIIYYCEFKDFHNDFFINDLHTLLGKPFN